ncbi:MAG: caspase family protein [Cyanobacteria bacterium P01_G01_bin.54]
MSGFENAHVLAIGISHYADTNIRVLDIVSKDVDDICEILTDPGFCGYKSSNVHKLLDQEATRGAIREKFARLSTCSEESTVLIYFSGHGFRIKRGGSSGEYLLPYDAKRGSNQNIYETCISSHEFTDLLSRIPARKLVVILDCCHAGGIGQTAKGIEDVDLKEGLSDQYYDALGQGVGRVILAASESDKKSLIIPKYPENSLFTHHLLNGLKGGAANSGSVIGILDLYKYVSAQVSMDEPKQKPVLKCDIRENFPIALYLGIPNDNIVTRYDLDLKLFRFEEALAKGGGKKKQSITKRIINFFWDVDQYLTGREIKAISKWQKVEQIKLGSDQSVKNLLKLAVKSYRKHSESRVFLITLFLMFLSATVPVRSLLLDFRFLTQSVYRQLTNQNPSEIEPITVVHIDNESLIKEAIPPEKHEPLDRKYLGKVVSHIPKISPAHSVTSINYVLDEPTHREDDEALRDVIKSAHDSLVIKTPRFYSETRSTKITSALTQDNENWRDDKNVDNGESTDDDGNIEVTTGYSDLMPSPAWQLEVPTYECLRKLAQQQNLSNSDQSDLDSGEDINCPLGFMIAVQHQLQTTQRSLRTILESTNTYGNCSDSPLRDLRDCPLIDFSIDSQHIYRPIQSLEFLESDEDQGSIFMVIPGEYGNESDSSNINHPLPLSVKYWRNKKAVQVGIYDDEAIEVYDESFTVDEVNAYVIHHLLSGRRLYDLPDFVFIFAALVLGKLFLKYLEKGKTPKHNKQAIGLVTTLAIGYILLSIQIFVGLNTTFILPIALPMLTFWLTVSSRYWVYFLSNLDVDKNTTND